MLPSQYIPNHTPCHLLHCCPPAPSPSSLPYLLTADPLDPSPAILVDHSLCDALSGLTKSHVRQALFKTQRGSIRSEQDRVLGTASKASLSWALYLSGLLSHLPPTQASWTLCCCTASQGLRAPLPHSSPRYPKAYSLRLMKSLLEGSHLSEAYAQPPEIKQNPTRPHCHRQSFSNFFIPTPFPP